MSDLPSDLVEEILCRVPTTSLKRLRSTCKRWNHFRKAPKQSSVLMLKAYKLCPISVDLNVVPPSVEFKDALDLKFSHSNSGQVDIAHVFHCDGLLLCITEDNKPVVWNPCLGESRWIQHEIGYDRYCEFALGYDNNQSCRSYKILMFWNSLYWENCQTNKPVGRFEIYELSSNSWRIVNPRSCPRIGIRYRGVTLKGNTYWISKDDNEDNYLLTFDFTGERFKRLCLPTIQNRGSYMALSSVREEELSVLCLNSIDSHELEMWVTKKIDTEAEFSWSKSFVVDLRIPRDNSLFAFTSLLIDEEKKVALSCNSLFGYGRNVVYTIGEDNEYYTEIRVMLHNNHIDRSWKPFIFNYVPSLVQIPTKVET
ncbi:hypothetical protein EUTSA_v10021950mg [Eutrema salsugineum]|uniref:F-box domain-containing protein n=1 Tax=Eutrema salsugineum TaxID=72664 RepID=V4LYI7_EUTSA|nr:hypothetical protein EUTSA_v10021950mg [Eutrema salsugineum]